MNRLSLVILMTGVLLVTLTSRSYAQTQKSSKIFLEQLARAEGGSGGAGNGGSNLVSDFYRQALVGLEYLKLTQLLDQDKLEKIHHSIQNSKVYPVSFQLCPLDEDTSCLESEAFASKNYPKLGLILLDARPLAHRFLKMTLSQKRRHALHEFAGLAGIELSNHYFSASVDSATLYEKFNSKRERQEYFSILGSFFRALPVGELSELTGAWRKETSIQRARHRQVKSASDLISGDAYALSISASNGRSVMVEKRNYNPDLNSTTWVYKTDLTLCKMGEMGLQCGGTDYRPGQRIFRRHERKYPEMFAEIELKHRADVYPLSCKPLDENQLICRHFFYYWLPYSPVQILMWSHEYGVYSRIIAGTIDRLKAK